MTIFVLGTADKRPVVYPLLYVLNLLGRTLFVSDDGAYRRLLSERGHTGDIGNVHVYVNAEINGEILERDKINPSDYEHVVYALLDDTGGKDGLTIYTKQDASLFRRPDPPDGAEHTDDIKVVYIGFAAPKDKSTLFIPITDSLLRELHAVENLCRLNPPKNAKVIRVLTDLLASGFGYGDKEMKRLLRYKGGRLT